MKKFQIALDVFSTRHALEILGETAPYVDIIELGTPLMIAEGCRVVKEIKEKYPEKIVFADIKVMDGGKIVPKVALEAGADMVSVLAAADDATIKGTIEIAREYNAKVLVDLCSVKDIVARAKEIEEMGPDYLCVHVGYDIQATGKDPIAELKKLDGITVPKAIAGGIKLENFKDAVLSPAEVIISGGGVYNQSDMEGTARKMREIMDNYRD